MNRTANVLVFMVFVFAGTIGWSATENTGSTVEKVLFDDDFESVAPGAPIRAKVGQWRGFGPLAEQLDLGEESSEPDEEDEGEDEEEIDLDEVDAEFANSNAETSASAG